MIEYLAETESKLFKNFPVPASKECLKVLKLPAL